MNNKKNVLKTKFEKLNQNIYLYYFYKELLTNKQQKSFEMYYYEDLTLDEIASNQGVSKIAVHDSLKKTEALLEDFENKLKLKEKVKSLDSIIQSIETNNNQKEIVQLIEQLKKIF